MGESINLHDLQHGCRVVEGALMLGLGHGGRSITVKIISILGQTIEQLQEICIHGRVMSKLLQKVIQKLTNKVTQNRQNSDAKKEHKILFQKISKKSM